VAAPPARPPDGDDGTPQPSSLVDWLRARDDRELAKLLKLRPDLALPAPPDLAALAGRLSVRTSTQRAVDSLDAFTLRALENLVLAADDHDRIVAPPEPGLAPLFERALIWGSPELVHLVPTVREAVGLYPSGLGRPAAQLFATVPDIQLVPVLRHLGVPASGQPRAGAAVAAALADPARVRELVDESDDEELDVLTRLAAGPPIGTVRNTRLAALEATGSAPHRLLQRGLLAPIDAQRVELPREVGLVLRAADPVPEGAEPPRIAVVEREPAELDRLGTTAVLDFLRLVDVLADTWTRQPPPLLRSGGVGVRELRRTARDLGVEEPVTALVAEVAYAASLINSTNGPEPVFLPTTEYDVWRGRSPAQRWIPLERYWVLL
jgi:hypothetical protein